MRIGLYEPIKNLYVGKDHEGDVLCIRRSRRYDHRGLGIAVASPTDLVKVRMQAEGKLPAGRPEKYPSAMAAYGIIAKQEAAALWTGLGPNVARNLSVINAAELASYDQVKSSLLASGMEDGIPTHLLSGLGAGLRGDLRGLAGGRRQVARGWETQKVRRVRRLRREDGAELVGVGAFYKGFIPNFGRLGSWNVVMFLTLEQVKKAMRERDL